MTTTTSWTPELEAVVKRQAFLFYRRHGGAGFDPEEIASEAYCHAAVAFGEWDGRGKVENFVGERIKLRLMDSWRSRMRKLLKHPPVRGIPEVVPTADTWDRWCRKLVGELGEDAAVVVRMAMESPGEVVTCLVGAGWSGPRVLAAMDEVREAVK